MSNLWCEYVCAPGMPLDLKSHCRHSSDTTRVIINSSIYLIAPVSIYTVHVCSNNVRLLHRLILCTCISMCVQHDEAGLFSEPAEFLLVAGQHQLLHCT
jgi:hypothetical protein